ncbi:MAG: putative Holliday junction resolvase [Actinomycetes bacterium]|jgi:putative Holliday junction resolvase
MRTGVRIGIDVGSVRVGIARSDATGTLAVPVQTVKRDGQIFKAVADLAQEYEALEILVGLPLGMSGQRGKAAAIASDFAAELAPTVAPTPVKLVDERLTTVQAQRGLHDAGKTTRQSRSTVDQAAAVIIVQHALDAEQRTGTPLGTTVGII